MASIFSKIAAGEIPAYKILEDDRFLAFLDVFPLKEGHTLVIPKQEIDDMYDLEPEQLAALQMFGQRVARAIKKAYGCKKVGSAVIGLEVPHAHLHLIPIDRMSDMDFTKPKLKLEAEQMQAAADKIKACL